MRNDAFVIMMKEPTFDFSALDTPDASTRCLHLLIKKDFEFRRLFWSMNRRFNIRREHIASWIEQNHGLNHVTPENINRLLKKINFKWITPSNGTQTERTSAPSHVEAMDEDGDSEEEEELETECFQVVPSTNAPNNTNRISGNEEEETNSVEVDIAAEEDKSQAGKTENENEAESVHEAMNEDSPETDDENELQELMEIQEVTYMPSGKKYNAKKCKPSALVQQMKLNVRHRKRKNFNSEKYYAQCGIK